MDGPRFHGLKIHAPPPGSSTDTSFPILTISILGIITTAILLLSYYVFVIKCCMNWRHADVITRLTITSSRRRRQEQLVAYTAADSSHGLSESAIRAIPTFRFSTSRDDEAKQRPFHECAVCLNEFQEMERLRLLPSCLHVFHIDCIDTWLQTNANCPVCRSNITSTSLIPTMEHMGHGQHQLLHHSGRLGIEISGDTASDQPPGVESQVTDGSPLRIDNKVMKKLEKVCSMGDECINVRGKHDNYSYYAQPMRRSFSMNSSEDRQLYVLLQQILQHKLQNPHFQEMWQQNPRLQEVGSGEGSSNGNSGSGGSSRFRRTFFPFRHCRSSRSEALPIDAQV